MDSSSQSLVVYRRIKAAMRLSKYSDSLNFKQKQSSQHLILQPGQNFLMLISYILRNYWNFLNLMTFILLPSSNAIAVGFSHWEPQRFCAQNLSREGGFEDACLFCTWYQEQLFEKAICMEMAKLVFCNISTFWPWWGYPLAKHFNTM